MGRLTRGVVSGARVESFDALTQRVRRMAGGLDALGVRQGDCVSILMRNDIAFLEASYAVDDARRLCRADQLALQGRGGRLCAEDSDSRALIGHTDLLAAVARICPTT
jgi:long-chain acyl-CoA synthetase